MGCDAVILALTMYNARGHCAYRFVLLIVLRIELCVTQFEGGVLPLSP